MRHLHAAGLHAKSPGEGSLFVAEELAFKQRARNRGTIHLHPRTGFPGRSGVDHASDDVLAGAALPLNEHGDVRAGNLGQPLAKSLHDIGAPKHDRLRRHLSKRLDQGTDWV